METKPTKLKPIESHPTTPIQQGLLYDCISSEFNTPLYMVQTIIKLDTPIDHMLFKTAVNAVVNDFSSLKTSYSYESLSFIETVYEMVNVPVMFYTYTSATDDRNHTEFLSEFLKDDLKNPFSLSTPPLMRFTVFKFSHLDYRIVWTRHHVLMDGTASSVLLKKILKYYYKPQKTNIDHLSSNNDSPPEKRNIFKQGNNMSDKKYWREALKNHHKCSLRPTPIVNRKCLEKNEILFYLRNDLFKETKEYKDRYNLSTNSILLAVWSITMSHFSNNLNIALGTLRGFLPKDGESPIGIYINTLPIICRLNLEQTVTEYLIDIRQQLTELKQHTITPLEQIKSYGEISANTTLFDVGVDYKPFSFENILNSEFPSVDFKVSTYVSTPYAMSVKFINHNDNLIVKVEYDCSLYNNDYVNTMLQHFTELLDIIIHNPSFTIQELPTVSPYDHKKILHIWNERSLSYPHHKTLTTLFENTATNFPNNIAIVQGNGTLTYAQLNQRANQLAHFLISQNVNTGNLIGLYLKSSAEAIIAILAILKSGCAYLPLDPEYPTERIQYFLNDSKANYIITNKDSEERLKLIKNKSTHVIFIDENATLDRMSIDNINNDTEERSLAYVLYTSGTTGQPKGVMLDHEGVINLSYISRKYFEISPLSRVLQYASLSFDASVFEIFMALLNAAALYIPNQSQKYDAKLLAKYIESNKLSHIILPPSLFEHMDLKKAQSLSTIIVGGEIFDQEIDNYPSTCKLYNGYGTTEATVCSTIKQIERGKPISIGKPLPNTKIYILDEQLKPSPINVYGEIYIAGTGLAKGYINSSINDKFFIKSPFSSNNKLYRTGDTARWLPNGEIDYHGRNDNIVKFNGFRVSLKEIEILLESHRKINKAIVTIDKGSDGKMMVAFIIKSTKNFDDNQIMLFLSSKLPYYMIPQKFITITEIPLTVNKKVDYDVLMKNDKTFSSDSHSKELVIDESVTENFVLAETIRNIIGNKPIFCEKIF